MKDRLRLLFCSVLISVMILLSPAAAEGCRSALRVCAELIIPSLFPFFILTGILNGMRIPQLAGKLLSPVSYKLFGVSGEGVTALFVSLCGGYPMGAVYIAEMKSGNIISRNEAERLMGFCSCSGFAFIIGAVGGGVFGSVRAGLLLFFTHALSALTVGVLLEKALCSLPASAFVKASESAESAEFTGLLTVSVRKAVLSVLNVCGFVMLFSLILNMLDAYGLVSLFIGFVSAKTGAELTWLRSFVFGIFELGCAFGEMRCLTPSRSALTLAAFILGWGGLSVHMQALSVSHDAEIKGTLHFTGHLMQAGIAAIYTYIFAFILK